MSSSLITAETPASSITEHQDLAGFGYHQELHRRVGSFASFAAGFSFVSILTTVFQLFFLGFGFGGAAFFWTWPAVFVGQILVALNFSTLAARFPISGAIFQWSSRLAGPTFGWFTGWVMVIGQILTVATAAIALQAVLPAIWSGFQLVGGAGADSSPTSSTGAANAVLLGVLLLVLTTAINIIGVRLMSVVTSAGVVLEILGVIAIVTALLFHVQRGPHVVLTTVGAAPTPGSSYIWAWLASGLMAAYVMVGFDSAGELSEETHAPRRTAPRTILRALVVSGVGGGLLIIAALMAAPSLTDGNLATVGLPWVLTSVMGPVAGRILLVDVTIAIFVCTLAVQTSGSRMVYSMAREKSLPFHRVLSRVSPRTGTPIATSIVVGVGAALALVVNIGDSALFTALASLCIAMLYLAYLGVTVPLLVERIRHARFGGALQQNDESGEPLFSLGRWGIAINVIAVVYQVVMFVNLVWPRASVYDLTGTTWWLQWSAILFIALTIVVGTAIHLRNRTRYGSMTFVAAHLSGHAPGHPVGHLVGHPSVLVPDVEGLA
jgi:urea carboxylase system permease